MGRIQGATAEKIQMTQTAAAAWPAAQSLTFGRVAVWWAFGSTAVNKASGCDGIPVEQFSTIKDGALKVLHSIWKQIRKTQQWPHDWERLTLTPAPKKGGAKARASCQTSALTFHASEVVLATLHARLQRYMDQELPDVQAGFRKGSGARDQIAKLHWIIEKAREFQKNICLCFIDYAKAFDHVDHSKLWKALKEMEATDPLTCLLKTCMWVKKQQLGP